MVRTGTTIVRRRSLVQIAGLVLGFPGLLGAQGHGHGEHGSPPAGAPTATALPKTPRDSARVDRRSPAGDVVASANASMSGAIVVSPYMKLTPERRARASDTVRAAEVVEVLRGAIAKYRDVRVAEADGYEIFAPRLPQEVYHFTSRWRSIRESFRFDPAQPSSLLYRKTPEGNFELLGAMYHAPKRLSLEELDARVPLGIARWHAHTNFCVPTRRARERWMEMKHGKPVFGPAGGITTREQCDAVGGRFHEQVFGWMVHAMVFAGNDPAPSGVAITRDMPITASAAAADGGNRYRQIRFVHKGWSFDRWG